jgi:hypothetical protein
MTTTEISYIMTLSYEDGMRYTVGSSSEENILEKCQTLLKVDPRITKVNIAKRVKVITITTTENSIYEWNK